MCLGNGKTEILQYCKGRLAISSTLFGFVSIRFTLFLINKIFLEAF